MNAVRVSGKNNEHKILLYALSTCAWCKRVKDFLKDGDVEFEYVDVDHCSSEEREEIRKDILSRGGRISYPTIIIDDKILITGFHADELREALGI